MKPAKRALKTPVKIDKESADKVDTKINAMQSLTHPINAEEKAAIAYLLGRFTSITDIQKYMKIHHKKEVNYESVKSIRDGQRWQPIIEKNRADWLTKVKEVPIANKRVRMEAWQKMMERGFTQDKMNIVKNALTGAHAEIEGITAQFGGQNNYSLTYIANMSDNELLKQKEVLMRKINRITNSVDDSEQTENIQENTTITVNNTEEQSCES